MRRILVFLIILSVLSGGFLVARSDLVEYRHRGVEIAVDFIDVQGLALEAVVTEEEILSRLKDLGATAVGLREASVARYRREGSLAVIQGGELFNAWRTTGTVHPRLAELLEQGEVSANAVYLVTDDPELADRLRHKAQLKLEKPVRTFYHSAPYVVEIMEDLNRVLRLRIGLDSRDVQLAQNAGLRIVPRPDNMFLNNRAAVKETMEEFLSLPREMLSAVIFEGTDVTGFAEYIPATAEVLNEAGIPFGIVEYNPRPDGALSLASQTDNAVVLVHSNWPRETVQAIVNSARERRVRLLYVRVNLEEPGFYEKGLALIAGVSESVKNHGLQPGPARPFSTPAQEPVLILLMLLGVSAAATLLFAEIIGRKFRHLWLVFLVIILGMAAFFAVLPFNLALQAASIVTAMVFSSLAVVTQQLNRIPRRHLNSRAALFWSLKTIGRTFLMAVAGGLVVLGLTSAPYFSAGVPLFRGVKLVHTLPLLAIAVAAGMRIVYAEKTTWTLRDILKWVRRILAQPVLMAYLIFLGILAVLGVIYVGRTGHTAGIPVPALELHMRYLLGEFLLVRPRFKEFLIGYPLALLGLFLVAKGYRNIVSAALISFGAIATVSVVNTFMHFTTPGYNTLLRSFNGLWLGLIFGLLFTATVMGLAHFTERVDKL
ncbi:MAG: DUF5693 family protein [Bacillota bacterium]|nr:DUF5693 family protein [Bacillota bacterium]MDW7684643.1 DUF5693 family protein [Bacillota bacterium]